MLKVDDRQTDGQTVRRINGGRTDGQTDLWIFRKAGRHTDGRTDRQTSK